MRAALLILLAGVLTLTGCKGGDGPANNPVDTLRRVTEAGTGDTVRDTLILWSGAAVRNTLIVHLEDRCYQEPPPDDCAEFQGDTVRRP